MSDTNRGEKGPGHEYGSRRHPDYLVPGPSSKKLTNRLERREAKQECENYEPIQEIACAICENTFDEDSPMWFYEWVCYNCAV